MRDLCGDGVGKVTSAVSDGMPGPLDVFPLLQDNRLESLSSHRNLHGRQNAKFPELREFHAAQQFIGYEQIMR